MRCKNRLIQLVFMALLFTFPTALMAQEALPQTFTSADGMITMNYPDGWTIEEDDGLIRVSTEQAFMQVNYRDYGEEVTPLEVIEIGTPEVLGFSAPENLIVAGYAALQSSSADQLHTIINFCGGTMALAIGYVNPGDMPTYAPTFMAMLDTIRYGDGEPEVCRGTFEGLSQITVANAAQVSQLTTFGDETVAIASVAFNPDGSAFAAGAMDGSVRVWSTVTGEELLTLTGHRDGATSVAFSSGGYNLVAGTGSGQVRLWDAIRGDGSGTLQEHSTAVESVAATTLFLVASGSLDGEVRVWDIASGGEQAVLVDSSNPTPVASVAFSPDEMLLVAGGGSTIRVWDVMSGTVQATLEAEISDIDTVSFSPDGTRLLYGGADPTVWVWDMAGDNHVLIEGDAEQVFALAFSPDGQVIATGDSGGLRLWDGATGTNLAALTSPSGEAVNSLAFSPTGTLIASAGDSGGVVLWGTSGDGGGQEAAASEGTSTTTETTTAAGTTTSCTITAPNTANQRSGPGTNFDRAGSLSAGQTAEVDGQATGSDGMIWYRLTDGAWVRSDVIVAPDECSTVPVVTP